MFQQRATTIEQGYADDFSQSGRSLSTTSPQGFIFITRQVVEKRQPALPVQDSPASLLSAYLTDSASEIIVDGGGLGTITGELLLNLKPRTVELQRQHGILPRRERHAAVIALLDEWLADQSDYDEKIWPGLKAQIEESRTSSRNRFGD